MNSLQNTNGLVVGITLEPDVLRQFDAILGEGSSEWVLDYYGLCGVGKTTRLKALQNQLGKEWTIACLNFQDSVLLSSHQEVLDKLEGQLPHDEIHTPAWDTYTNNLAALAENQKIVINQNNRAENFGVINQPTININIEFHEHYLKLFADKAEALCRLTASLDVRMILFIDHWDLLVEKGSKDLRNWLVHEMLLRMHQLRKNFRLVIAGSTPLAYDPSWQEVFMGDKLGICCEEVKPLDPQAADYLMRQEGIFDSERQKIILECTGGLPRLICMAGLLLREKPDLDLAGLKDAFQSQAASGWFLKQLVESLRDQRSREALKKGVILLDWILGTMRTLCDCQDMDLEWLSEFTEYPFIEKSAAEHKFYSFIPLVREIQVNQIMEQDPDMYRDLHRRALKWFLESQPV